MRILLTVIVILVMILLNTNDTGVIKIWRMNLINLTEAKFKKNGDFNTFRGNTVVANLDGNEELIAIVHEIQEAYSKLPFFDKFTLTPKKSIHMTVIELLCDKNRVEKYWSKDLDLKMPIDEVSEYFGEKLEKFPLKKESIKMKTIALSAQNIVVEPFDNESKNRLEKIRKYVSNETGVRFPNHDDYQFHISVGYLREKLTKNEEELFTEVRSGLQKKLLEQLPFIIIDRIDFTVFEDMTEFVPYENRESRGKK